ncbi:MAG: hypothetical protein R2818_06910 [Flavobacteriales bacterium]
MPSLNLKVPSTSSFALGVLESDAHITGAEAITSLPLRSQCTGRALKVPVAASRTGVYA